MSSRAGADDGFWKTEDVRERAILVGISRKGSGSDFASDSDSGSNSEVDTSFDELARLADTAGVDVVYKTFQRLSAPNPRTFIGAGKTAEISELLQKYDADVVIFDDELTPSQQSNLERAFPRNVKVIDRTALILDIFALHAKTKEGRLQVRLAQNQYLYPRLRGMWAHLASNRMGGGVGSRFGEGESQLEVDRRIVRKRITSIKRELERLSKIRKTQRESRNRSPVFRIALAGYTNAGKSSLLNSLTGSDVYSDDKLFATLDSTTRKLELADGRQATITDTVGFIQKLPTTLIEAFKSTLEEITESDLILHVVDASWVKYIEQIDSVMETLGQIGAQKIPVMLVFNKADLLSSAQIDALRRRFPNCMVVSAKSGFGLEELLSAIAKAAAASAEMTEVLIPYDKGKLVSLAHKYCQVISLESTERGTKMQVAVPQAMVPNFEPYKI